MSAMSAAHMSAAHRDKLIVALDLPGYDDARALVEHLGDAVSFYKIGLELVFTGGLDLARRFTPPTSSSSRVMAKPAPTE